VEFDGARRLGDVAVALEEAYAMLIHTRVMARDSFVQPIAPTGNGKLAETEALLEKHPSSFNSVTIIIFNSPNEAHQARAAGYKGDKVLSGLLGTVMLQFWRAVSGKRY
jgi:hypothetical protein